jgi:D-beta-D-heptose 7-phosphate kinase / D-beta-D-heptose 1-phosphate adenosyltransferase
MTGALVVIGDALLDRDMVGTVGRLCPDAPVPVVDDPVGRSRPGGAALAATMAALDGIDVVLVTALARDDAGGELRRLLERAGVDVVSVDLPGVTPQKVRVRADGRTLLRLDHGGTPTPPGPLDARARAAVASAGAVLVSDYGRGLAQRADVRAALEALAPPVPVAWDPHPRGAPPTPGVRLLTPNRREVAALAGLPPSADRSTTAQATAEARHLLTRWRAASVAVTLGDAGALLVGPDGPPMVVPAPAVTGSDACGAGDRFAVSATMSLREGALTSEAVLRGVADASAFVVAGGAAALRGAPGASDGPGGLTGMARVERIRAGGGTVVATGGCFDLLHAGHVGMLQAARGLGDCLVVHLNSDASVRRLKGPGRPIQHQDDRAAVLLALGCVDAVEIFGEDTPVRALQRLRPEIFAKGADYGTTELPEGEALSAWGGQAVVLPYLPGRSTTHLVDLATGQPSTVTGAARAR